MSTKHRQDIFDAIRDTLLHQKENRLSYSNLYKKVNEKLQGLKEKTIFKKLSPRDFSSEIKIMVEEGRLYRIEYKDSKRKIKPVYFSLTEKAIKEHKLKILGIDKEAEKRRSLYQFLFFLESLGPMKEVSDKQLGSILSYISAFKNDLVQESIIHTVGTNYTETNYRPIEYTKIRKVELSTQGPNGAKKVLYYCKLPGFSITEVRNYLRSSIRHGYTQFISEINFTEEEIKEAFERLRQADLIRPLHPRDADEIRYCIKNESSRDLIQKIWEIHDIELSILRDRWNHFEEPNDIEKEWLKHIFGKKGADEIKSNSYLNRKSFNKIKNEEEINRVSEEIKLSEKVISQRIQKLNKKYGKDLQEYNFAPDWIEKVCFKKLFSK
jgi:hypothetical protein